MGMMKTAAGKAISAMKSCRERCTGMFRVLRSALETPGRRYCAVAVLAVTAALSAVLAAGGSGPVGPVDGSSFGEPRTFDDKTLQVVQASPQGEVQGHDRKREVAVVFNHPLVPLSALDEKTSGVFRISPEIKGSFRWYGSRVCAFIPEKGWDYGQTYKIIVPKGTASLRGTELKEDYSFSFTFLMPEMEVEASTYPYCYGTIHYDQSFVLNFSQPVDAAEVKKKISLTGNGREVPCTVGYFMQEENGGGQGERRDVVVTPAAKFGRDAEVVLTIAAGIMSLEKDAQIKKEKRFEYRTHGPLTVEFADEAKFYQDLWESRLVFSSDIDLGAASKAIVVTPAVKWIGPGSGTDTVIPLTNWDFRSGAEYTIRIKPFPDEYGNLLENEAVFTVKIPQVRPGFSLEEPSSNIIESRMQHRVPVQISNMPALEVTVGKYSLKNIQNDLTDSNYSITENLDRIASLVWKTGYGGSAIGRAGFNLDRYLSPSRTGWLGLSFTGDIIGDDGEKIRTSESQLVQVTDLGISVQESYDASMIWVHSLHTGAPLERARIDFYDGSHVVGSILTNNQGYGRIPNGKKELLKNSLYVVTAGEDRAFVTSKRNEVPMYYLCGSYEEKSYRKKLQGQILFDRKLYRPGDRVFFKGVMAERDRGALKPVRNRTLHMTVSDSKGRQMLSRDAATTAEGGIWGDVEIPHDAPLGHYQVRIGSSRYEFVNDTFQVEEFRPVSFSVDVRGLRDARVGEQMKVSVGGRYLFGAPMRSAPVNWASFRLKRRMHFDNYSDYTFGDGQLWEDEEIDWSNAGYFAGSNGALDAAGEFSFTIKTEAMQNQETLTEPAVTMDLSDVYDLKVEATVKDIDDKSVTRTAVSRIFPGSCLIGIRSKNRYQGAGKAFEFDLVSLDNSGAPSKGQEAVVSVIRYDYSSILSKGPGRSLQPRNMLTKTLVKKQNIVLTGEPAAFSFRPEKPGSYVIIVQEKGGLSYSRDSFYAWGGEEASWFVEDDDSVSMVPDKREYRPGEKARVLIKSPYGKCKAILTLERESVIWQQTIELSGAGTPVEFPMKEEYLPNVYLSVMIIRPRIPFPANADPAYKEEFIANDLGAPRFKAGAVKLSVTNASKRAKLEMTTDRQTYGPGDTVTVNIATAPGAEVSLAAADRAVLDIIDYRYADPVNKFYQNWQLGVRMLENRSCIIKQYRYAMKGESPGGQGKGDALEGVGGFDKDSDDGTRRDIRYTAYWNPSIVADAGGNATVTFRLPQNLSSFRLMALASAAGKYGVAEKEITVRKALVIQKNLPRFIRPGDRLSMGAVVINQTGRTGNFRFSLESDLLDGDGKSSSVAIASGGAAEITCPVTLDLARYAALKKKADAEESTDQIMVRGWLSVKPENIDEFTAAGFRKAEVCDRIEFVFPVREDVPEEAFAVAGYTADQEKEFIRLPSPDKTLPHMGGLDITISSTALSGLGRAFAFYKSNPYFCLEQRASAFLLAMTSGNLLASFSFRPPSDRDYDFSRISDLFLGEAGKFQNSDGGFRFWKDGPGRSDPYLTAYVCFVLETAKRKGRAVDAGLTEKAGKYLKKYLQEPVKDSYSYVLETFSMIDYVLALQGDPEESLTDLLIERQAKLSVRAKCYLAMSIALTRRISDFNKDADTARIMKDVVNAMDITTRKVSFREEAGGYSRAFYSRGAATAAVLRMMIALDRNNPLIPSMVRYIMAEQSVWNDSHGAGMCALALHDYYEAFEKRDGRSDFRGLVTINGKDVFSSALDRGNPEPVTRSISMNEISSLGRPGTDYPMVFSSPDRARLYYTAALVYYPAKETVKPRDEGIEIRREIVDLSRASKNDRLGSLVSGELVRGAVYLCRLRIVAPKPCFNIVIVDPLPSSAEIVNTAFSTERSSMAALATAEKNAGTYWWMESRPNIEYRDDRVVITQDYMDAGMHEFTYLIRPVLRGHAAAPAASAKLMYEPEVFGRTGSSSLDVR